MKKVIFFKFLYIITILTFNQCFSKNFNIVNDAVSGIQATLEKESNPYMIKRTYNVNKDKVEVITKAYFTQYRKTPSYEKQVFHINPMNLSETKNTIEFTYDTSDKSHITQKNKKSKKSDYQKIAFSRSNPKSKSILS